MPITVQCASCKAKLRVPDHSAGKRVRCPKCKQGVNVPAAAPIVEIYPPQASQRMASPPPRPGNGAPPTRLPLLSFEELKIPKRLRKSVEEEVGDEKILWMGRPTPESLYSKAKIGMWAGLGISIAVVIGVVFGLLKLEGTTNTLMVAGIGGFALLTVGLPMATMPIWIRWLINYRDCYVMTPTRAIVFDNEKILDAVVRSYTPDELQQRHLHVNTDGTGSIVFKYELVNLGDHTTRRTRDREGSSGERIRETTIKTRRLKGTKGFGYVDIEDVDQVEAMLRQVFRLGPPGSKSVQ